MRDFKRYLVDDTPVMEAILAGYNAIFENAEGTAQHRTRKWLREWLPGQGVRPDDVAVDGHGQPILTAERQREQTYLEYFEYAIRTKFFHNGKNNIKFEPGIARIAYGELNFQGRERTMELSNLEELLGEISQAHASEYDANLNGMTYRELKDRFGSLVTANRRTERDRLDQRTYNGSRYKIEWIPDHEAATRYYPFTPERSRWCLTYLENQWNRYTNNGLNRVYFAHLPGFKYYPETEGQDSPLDDYGKSLISIIVGPEGNLLYCTCRWNHLNGGTDSVMDADELSNLLGGSMYRLCPPHDIDYLHEHGYVTVDDMKERLNVSNGSFTDPRDGHTYRTITIGGMTWLADNLSYDCGDGFMRNPDHPEYGGYYTLDAVKRAAPPGWRLPTREEWARLIDMCGGETTAGNVLKAESFGGSSLGFDVLPCGSYSGKFNYIGHLGYYWESTGDGSRAFYRGFSSEPTAFAYSYGTHIGLSARLVQDSTATAPINESQDRLIQGLSPLWYDYDSIRSEISAEAARIFREYDIDAEVVDVQLHGSRLRGMARDDSDLDAVLEYRGSAREDDIFNLLHDSDVFDMQFDGIRVDVNPIKEESTGTMSDYMEKSAAYDRQIIRGSLGESPI